MNYNLIFFLLFVKNFSNASHFRFGLITWKAISDNGATVTIEFTARWGWRRSFSSSYYCDQNTINAGNLIGDTDSIVCKVGCSGTIGDTRFACTAFSATDDWTVGERIFQYNLPKVAVIEASYTSAAWITLVSGGGTWEVRVRLDTRIRADTGKVNTAPVTTMAPVTCIRKGFTYKITIPWADADNDYVRCRWAESAKGECGGVCNTVPPAVLDSKLCELTFDGSVASNGWYAASIMLEDFKTATDTVPMSGVDLQFLFQIKSSTSACNIPPKILGDRAAGACIAVPLGTTVYERIVAEVGCSGVILKDIEIIGPTGTGQSSITQVTGSTTQYQITLKWTPIASQQGPNVICAKAIDNSCLSSDNHCFTLLAGINPPALVAGTGSPSGLLSGATLAGNNGVITWTVQFNKPILRPIKSSYISFYKSDGTLLFKMDAAVFPTVNYNGAILTFETGNTFDGGDYYILFDYGAGLGSEYCKAESDAVKDPTFWTFSIATTTTTTLATITAPATLAGQTLGFSGMSSTLSPILPVGATTNSLTSTGSGNNGVSSSVISTTLVSGSTSVFNAGSSSTLGVSAAIGSTSPSNTVSGSGTGTNVPSINATSLSTTISSNVVNRCSLSSFIILISCFWLAGIILHLISLVSIFLLFLS